MINLLESIRIKKGVKNTYEMSKITPRTETQLKAFEEAPKPSTIAIKLYAEILELSDKEIADLVLGRTK